MGCLRTDNYIEPSRVEPTALGPRFWVDGKPECGTFTLPELQAAYSNMDDLRSALWSGRIAIDATRLITYLFKWAEPYGA